MHGSLSYVKLGWMSMVPAVAGLLLVASRYRFAS
jgi:hypothetical protein